MSKPSRAGTVVLASLYRFGYELTVAARSQKQAHDALMEEYDRAYVDINGEDDEEFADLRAEAERCIEYSTLQIGKVEWR